MIWAKGSTISTSKVRAMSFCGKQGLSVFYWCVCDPEGGRRRRREGKRGCRQEGGWETMRGGVAELIYVMVGKRMD